MDGLDGEVDNDLEQETRSSSRGSRSSPEVQLNKTDAAASSEPVTDSLPPSIPNGGCVSEPESSEKAGQSDSLSPHALRPAFEPVKPDHSSDFAVKPDLPPMVKLEPDYNPPPSGADDVKSRGQVLLSSLGAPEKVGADKMVASASWIGKEEKPLINFGVPAVCASPPKLSPTSSSSCPPPLDMSIASAGDSNSNSQNPSTVAAPLHSPFMASPEHSGFRRNQSDLQRSRRAFRQCKSATLDVFGPSAFSDVFCFSL